MDERFVFDINDALKYYLSDPASIATPEADSTLVDCETDPESLTPVLINGVLNPIVDAITENPDAILKGSIFDSLQFLLKCAPNFLQSQRIHLNEPDSELFKLSRSVSVLPTHSLSKLFDVLITGLSTEADIIHNDLEMEEQDALRSQKRVLEMFAFLLQWSVSVIEVKATEKPATGVPVKGRGTGKGSKAKATGKDGAFDSSGQILTALDTMCKVLKSKLGRMFMTTSERDTFVGLFTRSVYLILENEQRIKNTTLRMHAFKVLCIAVKHHGHAFGNCNSHENSAF